MAYRLRAFIAERRQLEALAARLQGARVIDLTGSLGILPLVDGVESMLASGGKPPFGGLKVSEALAAAAAAASGDGPLAYAEADYQRDKDFQAAVVWAAGKVVYGPRLDATAWDPREAGDSGRPVNGALRLLGVSAAGFDDEWDAVGLARHIDTSAWT
ncbi:MAG: hypothetical protein HYZ75_07280 [Elusimicrobia bacterium]|nr:hypothetical protein [Elusimicrobiota bacterium]